MNRLPVIPLDYAELKALISSGVYPAERDWLEFKEHLSPTAPAGKPTKTKTPSEVFNELARDLASLAVSGGYLIYGVHEDKTTHVFSVVDTELPPNLDHQMVSAGHRVSPRLEVEPTLLTNPAKPGFGLMVIEVPESPEAPHNVGGTYYTRSSIGKEPMRDDEVERLILRRRKVDQLLTDAMRTTAAAARTKLPDVGLAHFCLTAMPTRGHRDMFAKYTRSQSTRAEFLSQLTTWVNQFAQSDLAVPERTTAFSEFNNHRRTQATQGAWFEIAAQGIPSWRGIGLDDDGTFRFYDRLAGSLHNGVHPVHALWEAHGAPRARAPHNGPVIYEEHLWHDTVELVALFGLLAAEVGYTGAWLIGLTVDDANGRGSALSNSWMPVTTSIDTEELTATARASASDIRNAPRDVAARLIGPILRELGTEHLLAQWNPSQT